MLAEKCRRGWCGGCEYDCPPKVTENKRAVRRHHLKRLKKNAGVFAKRIWKMEQEDITPVLIGQVTTQHFTCDCWMCKGKHEDKDISDLRKPQFIKEAA
jgi:hypothetical protein